MPSLIKKPSKSSLESSLVFCGSMAYITFLLCSAGRSILGRRAIWSKADIWFCWWYSRVCSSNPLYNYNSYFFKYKSVGFEPVGGGFRGRFDPFGLYLWRLGLSHVLLLTDLRLHVKNRLFFDLLDLLVVDLNGLRARLQHSLLLKVTRRFRLVLLHRKPTRLTQRRSSTLLIYPN